MGSRSKSISPRQTRSSSRKKKSVRLFAIDGRQPWALRIDLPDKNVARAVDPIALGGDEVLAGHYTKKQFDAILMKMKALSDKAQQIFDEWTSTNSEVLHSVYRRVTQNRTSVYVFTKGEDVNYDFFENCSRLVASIRKETGIPIDIWNRPIAHADAYMSQYKPVPEELIYPVSAPKTR
ncbi:MAG: hypothetical protein NUW37_00485 [Planctomycetes bacterium]|nr:hypothetical protein [Planctomycetota bacterium]